MPSKKPSDQSGQAQDHQEESSVFDFLYYDQTRIASFLAQFDPAGHLTQITNSERAHRGRKQNITTQAAASVAVAKGSISDALDTASEYGQAVSKSYDPRWANALAFLDYLEQKGLLQRDINNARIGEIALISGDLALFDLGFVEKMWGLPVVRKLMLAGAKNEAATTTAVGNRHERRKHGVSTKSSKEDVNEAELALELLSVMPHAIQSAVSNDDASVWSSLRHDSITINATDLFMKHGMSIEGTWNLVGILDAFPDNDVEISDGMTLSAAKQFLAGSRLGMIGVMLGANLVTPVRSLLGRPGTSYGFTPLLLFRTVA